MKLTKLDIIGIIITSTSCVEVCEPEEWMAGLMEDYGVTCAFAKTALNGQYTQNGIVLESDFKSFFRKIYKEFSGSYNI